VAWAMAQGFKHPELEPWALLSPNKGPRRPGFDKAGPGWLTALGWARHITRCEILAISTSSTPQEPETETEYIEILFLLHVYMTQSYRC
jgi:hypothetical protein